MTSDPLTLWIFLMSIPSTLPPAARRRRHSRSETLGLTSPSTHCSALIMSRDKSRLIVITGAAQQGLDTGAWIRLTGSADLQRATFTRLLNCIVREIKSLKQNKTSLHETFYFGLSAAPQRAKTICLQSPDALNGLERSLPAERRPPPSPPGYYFVPMRCWQRGLEV